MSSIDLTVTSRIVHLRHREKTFAEVQLDRAPKLIAEDDLGFLLPKATQRWNEQLHNRFRAVGWGHVRSSYGSISRAAVRGGRLANGRARAPGTFEQENDDDDGAAARARRASPTSTSTC